MINAVYLSISELMNSDKRSFEGKDGSTFILQDFTIFERPSFLDYLRSGI